MRKNPSWFSRDAAREAAAKRWAAEKDADREPQRAQRAEAQTLRNLADKILRRGLLGHRVSMAQLQSARIVMSLPESQAPPQRDLRVIFRCIDPAEQPSSDETLHVQPPRPADVSQNASQPNLSDAQPTRCERVNRDSSLCAHVRPCPYHEPAEYAAAQIDPSSDVALADAPSPATPPEPRTWADAARKDDSILQCIGHNPNRSKGWF